VLEAELRHQISSAAVSDRVVVSDVATDGVPNAPTVTLGAADWDASEVGAPGASLPCSPGGDYNHAR
jgi:hypothetical protein